MCFFPVRQPYINIKKNSIGGVLNQRPTKLLGLGRALELVLAICAFYKLEDFLNINLRFGLFAYRSLTR